jgi:hypothetical protein
MKGENAVSDGDAGDGIDLDRSHYSCDNTLWASIQPEIARSMRKEGRLRVNDDPVHSDQPFGCVRLLEPMLKRLKSADTDKRALVSKYGRMRDMLLEEAPRYKK